MRKIVAWVLIVVFTLVTVADLGLTFYNTPDLAREANPLVSRWGFGWPVLLAVNVVVLLVYCFLVYYSWVIYPQRKRILRTGGGGGGSYLLALLGFSLSFSMILSRLLLVIQWGYVTAGVSSGTAFHRFFYALPTRRPDLFVAGGLTVLSALIFFVVEELEDRRYQRMRGGRRW